MCNCGPQERGRAKENMFKELWVKNFKFDNYKLGNPRIPNESQAPKCKKNSIKAHYNQIPQNQ